MMQIKDTQKEFVWILKKKLEKCHDLYVQSDALLLVDVFQNSRNMCLEMYELDPARFLTSQGLAWEAALKKTKVKLDILTDINIILMVEKGIRGEICHAIYRYAKTNNKYMKDYNKNKKSPYLKYWDVNNLYGWGNVPKIACK